MVQMTGPGGTIYMQPQSSILSRNFLVASRHQILDICGTELLDDGGNGVHMCPLLGQYLKKFCSVRLRNAQHLPRALSKLQCY